MTYELRKFFRRSPVEMKSQELYATLRERLAPLFKASGFKRSTTMLSWVRPRGSLYEGVWCQADRRGWDSYAGSKFAVEFQFGPEPVIGGKTICRRRIGDLLNPAEQEEARAIQNRVIASLRKPPKNYAVLNVCEEVSTLYLKEFDLLDQPYCERDDIWFRYASKEDVDRWATFLVDKLPNCLRQVETWDEQTPLYR
jgi:hypothetical protein